ncbi:MAG: phosphatidylglycerophosphatase A [Betaproteobacteria bacterium]
MPRVAADWRFVVAHPAHFIAFGFGSGLAPIAPGTFGSLVGIPLTLWLLPAYGDVGFGAIIAAAFALGVWACDITGKRLGITDYGGIVWDEVVAMMLVLWFVPLTWRWILLAFLLFRVFDIIKLPPAGYFDSRWKNGLGVMLDDIAAAVHALIVLAILRRLLG